MNFIEYIILGIIQGITEFLPISSSGHLLIGRSLFNLKTGISGSFIEIFLHGGTLLSILLYWRKDLMVDTKKILSGEYTMLYNIIIGTIPAAIVGFLFKNKIDLYLFNVDNITYLSISYFSLAIILFFTKRDIANNTCNILFKYAFIIGIAQSFAIIPGISRAGITIATALYIGIDRENATKFSFMLAIPILFVSFFGSLIENHSLFSQSLLFWPLIVGFLSSFIVGYLAIGFLVNVVNKNKLWYFSVYCLSLSFILIYHNGI